MPITIPREGRATAPPPQIDQSSRDRLWSCYVTAYIARHPEKLRELDDGYKEVSG